MKKKPKKFDYNLVAIGGGAGGLVSSYIAAVVKAKVALVEKHKMGGDCLNYGCVPSKALIKSAKVVHSFQHAQEYGIKNMKMDYDFSDVMARVHKVIAKIEPHDSVERYEGLGVECFQDEATIVSPYEVKIGEKIYTTQKIIIATGAEPLIPNIDGIDKVGPLTSDSLWDIKVLPKRLVVLGGGPIGCELAQAFSRLGSSVTQVELAPRIMAREDEDVSSHITKRMTREGVKILTGHKAVRFVKEGEKKSVICETSDSGTVEIEFDEVLVAVGRKPRSYASGISKLGIALNPNKTIKVNKYLQTNFKNIYACGDVVGPYQFTHTAAHQAWYATVNALFGRFKKHAVDYRVIPWCTYTDPEVARVGLNEIEAKEQGIPYDVSTYGLDDLDRAITEGEGHGFVKVLTVHKKDTILGATIVGHHGGDIICEYVAAMKHGFGMNSILGTIHIYPTLAEANKYVAGSWKKANSPKFVLKMLEKFHGWTRG